MSTTAHSDNALHSVAQSAQYLACSRGRIYQLLRAGELVAVRDGQRLKIRRSELDGYIDRLPSYEPAV